MELHVQNRTLFAKKTKRLRKEEFIPVELYGKGIENKHLQIGVREFEKVYRKAGKHTMITAETEDKKRAPVFITEVYIHPVTRQYKAANLRQVRMDETMETKVPLEFRGESEGVKEGLTLIKTLSHLEVEALPEKIPGSIPVDISVLRKYGDTIEVKDIELPPDIKILVQPETVIASLAEKAEEEKAASPAAPAEETQARKIEEGAEKPLP